MDYIKAILFLSLLVIWRLIIEIVRVICLIILFIPMLISPKVYNNLHGFFYKSIEEQIKEDEYN